VNIVSLSKNLYKLKNFLTQVRYAPDIIAITETRIKYTVPYIMLICRVINLYMLILTKMLEVLVGLYVKNCIDFIILNKLQIKKL